jgi:threonine synthase
VKNGKEQFDPQKPNTIARSLAIGNPADGNYASAAILKSGGWAEDVSDAELVAAIELLAETEGIFGETAGGVTLGVTQKLIAQGRIGLGETTVICNTGNGLKTTEALAGQFELDEPILPRLADFERAMSGAFHAAAAGKSAAAGG